MALRDQPYLPLYVQDVISDEKLHFCAAESYGVYFLLMCWLHKQQEYGVMYLQDEFKEKDTSKEERFAKMITRLMPFETEQILRCLRELQKQKVINITEETLYQKRMVADAQKSKIQSENRAKGWAKADK